MPELPEVETIARGLASRVSSDVIESVWLGQKPQPLKSSAREIAAVLEHSRIATVRRVGQHIVFDLEPNHARPNHAALTLPSASSGQTLSAKGRAAKSSRHRATVRSSRISSKMDAEAEQGGRPTQGDQQAQW